MTPYPKLSNPKPKRVSRRNIIKKSTLNKLKVSRHPPESQTRRHKAPNRESDYYDNDSDTDNYSHSQNKGRGRGDPDGDLDRETSKHSSIKNDYYRGGHKIKLLSVPEKPTSDPKGYRVIQLENGAKVVLISELRQLSGNASSTKRDKADKNNSVKVNLPYISDSRNVYVGQTEKDNKKIKASLELEEKITVQDVCCNCNCNFGGAQAAQQGSNSCDGAFNFFQDIDATEAAWLEMDCRLPTATANSNSTNSDLPLNNQGAGKEAQMVSCAVTVGSGFLDEPAKYGGLAHFCEHMVFLGSRAYPKEDEFMSVVREYGGQLNACTMPESTHYYYSISNSEIDTDNSYSKDNLLDKSMDLFSHFFTEPKFEMEAIKREINALDHEFRMKRPNDMVCRLEILKHSVKKGHPMKNFFWGDKNTLGGDGTKSHYDDLRKHLQEFHREHYVGPNITIALQGHMTLDDLEHKAIRHFSKLRCGSMPCKSVPRNLEQPFHTEEFNRRYSVKPVGALDSLYLSWSLSRDSWDNYKTKPLAYLSQLISSEISGGLSDFLQKEQLIVGLQCGLQIMSRTKYGVLFVIKMYVTDAGIQYQDDIIEAVFGYIDSLREKNGMHGSAYRRMQDIRDANLVNYGNYRPQLLNVKKLSYSLQLYPPQHIISGDTKFYEFDKKAVESVLFELRPQNLNVMLFSHAFGKQSFPHVENNTKCQFHYSDFTNADLKLWDGLKKSKSSACGKFNVPSKVNPYMTTDFTKLNHQGVAARFMPVVASDKLRVSFIPMGMNFPFSYFHVMIQSKSCRCTGRKRALLQLWASILLFELREPMGLAQEAGIMSNVQPGNDGNMHVVVYGYDKMAAKLVKDITHKIGRYPARDKEIFHFSKEYMLKMLHYILLYPSSLAYNLLTRAWKWGEHSLVETHSALVDIQQKDLQEFVCEYMDEMRISMMALGNSRLDEVQTIADSLDKIQYKALKDFSIGFIEKSRIVALPRMQLIWRVDSLNKNGSTSTLINHFQFSHITVDNYIMGFVLMRMMAQPMFSELRTRRSLGYAVGSGLTTEGGILGAIFLIISDAERFTTEQLDREVDEFLVRFYTDKLKPMSQNEFLSWAEKVRGCPLHMFTVDQLRAFYSTFLLPNGPACRKLSIQVAGHHPQQNSNSKKGGKVQCTGNANENLVTSETYKRKLELISYSRAPTGSSACNDSEGAAATYYIQNIDMLHSLCPLYPAQ